MPRNTTAQQVGKRIKIARGVRPRKIPRLGGRSRTAKPSCETPCVEPLPQPVARPGLLHELFEATAHAQPSRIAVEFGPERITYAELDSRANQLARHLHAQGLRRGARVALFLPRSVDAYVAMLGILKCGGAYVPLDPEYPAERIAYILNHSQADGLVTNARLANALPAFQGVLVRMDCERCLIEQRDPERMPRELVGVTPWDLCYVIYTSGSTGKPKGVMIEHHNAHHLVSTEGRLFGVHCEDRVYQGFSLCFDASIEEIWLAFHSGATLVAATPEMAQAGPDLSHMLTQAGVTVLSCVPTLLTMMADDTPTVRLLILGGEACPEHLVERWWRPDRRLVNTYGPTETTVIATCADLRPGEPVTIGRAIPGYRVLLLDEKYKPVHNGDTGEIWIGGAGVGRGYVGATGQTDACFLPDPFADWDEEGARIYRTGDLGRMDSQGRIIFAGRADAQVKVRGFRVELGEIESALLQCHGVRAAACALHQTPNGAGQLVGYVVPANGGVDPEQLRAHLRSRLPAHMVPAQFETLRKLPCLPSGKLDRTALPVPQPREISRPRPAEPTLTTTERKILRVWEELFVPQPVSLDDDFFLNLGGHSLLAARMVSALRKDPAFVAVSMADVYDHSTIRQFAAAFDARQLRSQQAVRINHSATQYRPVSEANERRRHFIAGLLQSTGLYFVFGFQAIQWITPYFVYFLLLASGTSVLKSIGWAAAAEVAVFPALLIFALAAKWTLLGRIRAGRYPLWGGYYVRWWLVRSLVGALHLGHLRGTPLLPLAYRLFGMRVGRDVHLETDDFAAFDVTSIGDGTSVDDHASALGYSVEGNELVIGPVRIGRNCFVGTRSVLRENTVLEDGARLEDQSLLSRDGRIPAGETWAGSPAKRVANPTPLPAPPQRSSVQRAVTVAVYALLSLVFPLLVLSAFAPGVAILTWIDLHVHPWLYLAATPLVGASFVLVLTLGTTAMKWLLLGRVRPGTYPAHGSFYIRKWVVDQLLATSLEVAGSLHATLYLAPWYRALGAKLGRFVELSTATSMTPDLLEIGDGGTVADEASLGAARVENGWLVMEKTRLGRRAFVGNGAVVPQGTTLGDGALVGVVSISPANGAAAEPNRTWLGSPAIPLPRRQESTPFPDERTYWPSRKLRLARGAFEILRVTLPPAGFILVMSTTVTLALSLWGQVGLFAALVMLPVIYAAGCMGVALGVVALKWILMGRFRPFEKPLWCFYVWKLEFVNALYEFMLTPLTLEALHGTPFLPWFYRLLGARIGRRTFIHTTGLIEFDLVEVGDRTVVHEDAVLQAHLFEDRVLKADRLSIGRDCLVGAGSVVLYDSKMEDGARLDALSLVMKGEVLPAESHWAGSPAQRVNA